ncbi:MAG: hypothetical protein L6V85_09220 [Clostridiales bacterium]|nr:MAG: hypothetical protein L6V85_09220 [Clostridiales bacterium]
MTFRQFLKAIAPDLDLNAILTQILSKIDLTGVTVEGVQKLLDTVLGELSFYSHPLLKKCWQSDFVSDTDKALATTAGTTVDMSDYAWVKYTCRRFRYYVRLRACCKRRSSHRKDNR